MDHSLQLEMNFSDAVSNRFQENLNQGNFIMLTEINAPGRDLELSVGHERLRELEFEVAKISNFPAGIAFTNNNSSADSWHVADFAAGLVDQQRDNHLIYLSGRDSTITEMTESLNLCEINGFRNIVPVSGDHLLGENSKKTAKRHFNESVHLLHYLQQQENSHLWAGATVNPFQYTPDNLYSQLFKMVKKLNLGANFLVTNFGWDMLKLQELRWYLDSRNLYYPTIARLQLLTPEMVEKIIQGKVPGVHISRGFRKLLENELRYSYNQFESAQWRRLQLQAAGCRLMGYSGIQIAGLNSPAKINTAAIKISRALTEFTDLAIWQKENLNYLAKTEMAPFPYCFYLFDNMSNKKFKTPAPTTTLSELPQCRSKEKINYKIKKFLFPHAHRQNAREHFISKKIFASCRECSRCRLPMTQYICPETCPKGLANGPCGGARPDGKCEVGDFECIHNAIMRLAAWNHELDRLEYDYIEPTELKSRN
jgi:methylenetetrahydrofolate reductase (NADPH)